LGFRQCADGKTVRIDSDGLQRPGDSFLVSCCDAKVNKFFVQRTILTSVAITAKTSLALALVYLRETTIDA
jgi:hypothetical protein